MADTYPFLKELPLKRRRGKSHPCLRVGRQTPGKALCDSSLPSLLSQEGPAKLLDPHSVEEGGNTARGFRCPEFSSAHSGPGTVLSALHDPSAFSPHVEVDAFSIFPCQLGKLRLKEVK